MVQAQSTANPTSISHGIKSRILTRLVADIYEFYTAYPSTKDLEIVAKALEDKYPGMKDGLTGRGCEAVIFYLMKTIIISKEDQIYLMKTEIRN